MKNKKQPQKITYIGRMKGLGKGVYSRAEITDPNKKTTKPESVDRSNNW